MGDVVFEGETTQEPEPMDFSNPKVANKMRHQCPKFLGKQTQTYPKSTLKRRPCLQMPHNHPFFPNRTEIPSAVSHSTIWTNTDVKRPDAQPQGLGLTKQPSLLKEMVRGKRTMSKKTMCWQFASVRLCTLCQQQKISQL